MIFSGALAHIDTLHVDWHLGADWQVRTETHGLLGLLGQYLCFEFFIFKRGRA